MSQTHITEHKRGGLGELAATAICGNDITSSCLYVSALAILYAGRWAPVVLLMVAVLLYLFRSIYGEVVGALPLNGGAYNALLNTTSKFRASIAACLTILSYMATAVISSTEAMHYAHALWEAVPVTEMTVLLLAAFLGLTIFGIAESAFIAIIIFVTHLAVLSLLVVAGLIHVIWSGFGTFSLNLGTPEPGGIAMALFFGFSAALLGISGFESSANFVEEQAENVFPKTLRNMWIAVSFFNPVMALLALALIPIPEVADHQEALLAHMGLVSGGTWLSSLISIDAFLVLSGAVLTSFIGVNGLIRRMTLDRCLPQLLLQTNSRGTTHRILVTFFLLCVSVLAITGGELEALAGVYTLSFLAVMLLFATGNILLKAKREGLPRPERAPWPVVFLGMFGVSIGLVGTVLMNPTYLRVFLEYFIPTLLVVSIMLGRLGLLRAALVLLRAALVSFGKHVNSLMAIIQAKVAEINSHQVVFFTRGDNIANLNNAMLYVRRNEHTNRIKIVTVVRDRADVPPTLAENLEFMDKAYPQIDIEFVIREGEFTPELIETLSREWNVPTNFMFIGSPSGHLIYGLAELGGVRLIV